MGKFFSRFFITIFILISLIVFYLSYFGIETDKFDSLIKGKANEVSKFAKLEFKNTKIHLNIKEVNLAVKLQNPKILIKSNEIILSKIDLFLPLKSFITSDFLLKRAEIAFYKNDIKDLVKISEAFLPRFFNKKLNKVFSSGNLQGEFVIPFNPDGSLADNYEINAKLLDSNLNINKNFKIYDLSTDIKYVFKSNKNKKINFFINKGNVLNLDLRESSIDINLLDKKKIINSKIRTNGTSKYSEIKTISSLLGIKLNNIENLKLTSNLETLIKLSLNDKFKIENKEFSVKGKITELNLEHKDIKDIKQYLPSYNSKIILKDSEIIFDKNKNLSLLGLIKFNEHFENFNLDYNGHLDKNFNIDGKISLYDLSLSFSKLNYFKKENTKANLNFNVNIGKKFNEIRKFEYSSENSKIFLDNIKLNKKLEIRDIKKIEIKTFVNSTKNNDFNIIKNNNKNITISGELFDAEPLLKSLYKTDDKKTLSKNFSSEVKVDFNRAITGTNDDVSDFSMIASVKKGSYNKLSLKGKFSKDDIVEMSIYQIDDNKKTLQVISDRARPFIKNFDFIKGFEEGKLEYEATISDAGTNSNLIITDFKVSKVPALAQLLTLASLQGIADTLSGEGIRFDSFEMRSNSKGNVMNIEDALAMGPAVSILLSGYVDKGKVVSLRGTLVPATKLNSIIASIPLVGDILVGKKTGEGVVGVSFKMKGPPKDIKTTVNPIKTLTPRFIVRAVEKMKKKKKGETK